MGLANKISILIAVPAILLAALVLLLRNLDGFTGAFPFLLEEVNYSPNDIPSLDGKVMLVTGANVGLGKSNAKFLALNGAVTVMGCRSLERCNQAIHAIADELRESTPRLSDTEINNIKGRLVPMKLDLNSLKSVKEFAHSFSQKYSKLHSLVLNAGIMHVPFGLTEDGVEQQWGVNHLGHFYLMQLLTKFLKAAQPSTVVVVSSNAHFFSYNEGVKLTLEGDEGLNDPQTYNTLKAYGQSKLCNILMAQELAKRFADSGDKIFVNSLNPGGVNTNLAREYTSTFSKVIKWALERWPDTIFYEPDTAALTQLYVGTSPNIFSQEINGKYFTPIAHQTEPSPLTRNNTLQDTLWSLSEQILIDKGFGP